MTSQDRDPRIYFAAERTFLAWIRTGLALMGFGFVVARFGLFLRQLGNSTDLPIKTLRLLAGHRNCLGAGWSDGKRDRYHPARQNTSADLNAGRDVTGKPSATGVGLALLLAAVGLAMSAYLLIFR